jgi:hypothetical protein
MGKSGEITALFGVAMVLLVAYMELGQLLDCLNRIYVHPP